MGMGDDSDVMDLTRNIMMVLVMALFAIVIFLVFLHLYAKWYWYRHRLTAMDSRQQQGLDVSSLKIIEFHPNDFEHGLECAICLSDLEEGDKARILPKCDHGFHMECIDMWFHSHSTCPICRDQISQQQQQQQQSPTPTHDDVFMNHNHHHQEEPSSSSLQDTRIRPDLVIDIPAIQHNQQEQVSSTGCSSGMRSSLKRMFSPGSSSNAKSCPLTP